MPKAIPATALADFQCKLIGTWKNTDELMKGDRPLSYNVMPLPQVTAPSWRPGTPQAQYGGFILKNFSFTETIRFNGSIDPKDAGPGHYDPEALAVSASAPNRGGTYTQSAHAIFYDQQVRFAEGPDDGKIVHVENGAWIHFGSEAQLKGPYENNGAFDDKQILRQSPYVQIAKQISVPHGNSVLALGNVDLYAGECVDSEDKAGQNANSIIPGAPVIPDALPPYPEAIESTPFPEPAGIATDPRFDPYATKLDLLDRFENPNEKWALNPNYPLQLAVQMITPVRHIHWRVTTLPLFGGDAAVTNVPFEDRKSEVTEYWAEYWLMAKECEDFNYLAYNQTILMEMDISLDEGQSFRRYIFPHVTTNVVKKLEGTPSEARAQDRDAIEEPAVTPAGRSAPAHCNSGKAKKKRK